MRQFIRSVAINGKPVATFEPEIARYPVTFDECIVARDPFQNPGKHGGTCTFRAKHFLALLRINGATGVTTATPLFDFIAY